MSTSSVGYYVIFTAVKAEADRGQWDGFWGWRRVEPECVFVDFLKYLSFPKRSNFLKVYVSGNGSLENAFLLHLKSSSLVESEKP